ncbi:hypothetical protein [Micromonospora sp. CPCC 205561]|uniref:hypothetical protein n=1 Tax=Micromonospora sp. CPCC 205561 TaxID=3122407 RepID=UPI002FF3C269
MAGVGQKTRAEPATADREIVVFRVIDALRELAFEGGQRAPISLAAYVTGTVRKGVES